MKLDENLAQRHQSILEDGGHDVATVAQQGIRGIGDVELFECCREEGRALVTLDLDFANVLSFPPGQSAGIIVLRGRSALLSTIDRLIEGLIQALEEDDPTGSLWIVEPGRLRIHQEE